MTYIDSHAHIDGEIFDSDRDEVVGRAKSAGVSVILNVGTGDPSAGNLERAVTVCDKYEGVFAAIGIHPHDARLFNDQVAERILHIVRGSSRVIALGEIGLDYHYDYSPRDLQRKIFASQLRMARDVGLPVIIHSREADDDTLTALRTEWSGSAIGGIMHCFGGSLQSAQELLKMKFLISFAGNVTFKNAQSLRDIAGRIPLDKLLIETDSPFLTPVPYRGKRNEPARVVEVAKCLGDLHGISSEEIGHVTSKNFCHLFKHIDN